MGERAPGEIVAGRFQLDRLIGEGGMGVVWAATHMVTRRPIALKMLKPESAADPSLRQRFFREARAACAVRHPNILEIHDVIELEDGTPVMVMDLLQGESLGHRLDRTPVLPPTEVARLMLPVVSAVGTAHASGIVHRDLKPDNIFVAEEGDGSTLVKVLDFGIAKIFAVEASAAGAGGLTGTGAILGTPYYMAPEQIFGERDIDHRADIWALGVILYECLSGRRPTEADNVGQILKIITTESLVPLEVAAPSVPADLARLVGRMLSRDRNARPQSLAEVQAGMRRYTDVAVRSFGNPAISSASLVPAAASSASSLRVASAGDSGAVRLGSADVSGTAATLASTTADRRESRGASGSRARVWVGAALAAVALGAIGVVGVRVIPHGSSAATPTVGRANPASTASSAASQPAASQSTAPAPTAAAPSAGAAPLVDPLSHAPAAPAPPAASSARVRPSSAPPPRAVAPSTAASPNGKPTATPASPGGVVEKPPF